MKDQIPRKQLLASTKSESKEDEVLGRRIVATAFKTQLGSASKRPSKSELQDSQAKSKGTNTMLRRSTLIAGLSTSYKECLYPESPLKGTPWEDAGFSCVASSSSSPRKNQRLTRRSSAKDEESIADFWMKFFG